LVFILGNKKFKARKTSKAVSTAVGLECGFNLDGRSFCTELRVDTLFYY